MRLPNAPTAESCLCTYSTQSRVVLHTMHPAAVGAPVQHGGKPALGSHD